MCGRTACTLEPNAYYDTISKNLGSKSIQKWNKKEDYSPSYNFAPTTFLPVVYMVKSQNKDEEYELHTMRWGLIPSFYKSINSSTPMHNARGETVADKPIFNRLLSSRRCICMVEGFYEWKRDKKHKQPYFVKSKDGNPMFIAGLYDSWNSHDDETIHSFTLITVQSPEKYAASLHDRLPIILNNEESIDIWLNFEKYSKEKALELIKPIDTSLLEFYPVSDYVNKSGNDGEKCLKKVDPTKRGPLDKFFTIIPKKEKKEIKEEQKVEVETPIVEPSSSAESDELLLQTKEDQLDSQDLKFIEQLEKNKDTIDLIEQEEEENEWNLKRKQRTGEDHEWIEFKKIKFTH